MNQTLMKTIEDIKNNNPTSTLVYLNGADIGDDGVIALAMRFA